MWKLAAASLYDVVFLDTEEHHGSAPPQMVEYFKAPEVDEWKGGLLRDKWDAMDTRNAGAELTAWETPLEKDRLGPQSRRKGPGCNHIGSGSGQGFECVSLSVVWGWATRSSISF